MEKKFLKIHNWIDVVICTLVFIISFITKDLSIKILSIFINIIIIFRMFVLKGIKK